MFELIKRDNALQNTDCAFIGIRSEHINFNSYFSRIANLKIGMRVKFYIDSEFYKIGFLFINDISLDLEKDSFSLTKDKTSFFCGNGELKKYDWIKNITKLPNKQRRFEPVLEKTEIGKLWVINLCPSFEIKRARESKEIKGNEVGIYRYIRGGEVVYIGRGNILERLNQPIREEWDFDLVEYSKINVPDDQIKWEYYWIEQYKNQFGKLPIYNKIGGSKKT